MTTAGIGTGDYLRGLARAQLAQHGLTLAARAYWRPPPTHTPRGQRSSATEA